MKKMGILDILNNNSQPPLAQKQRQQNHEPSARPQKSDFLPIKSLVENKNNFYDTRDLGELKASIELFGIMQPLLVSPLPDGCYKVIAGHRRLLAAQELYADGNTELEFIPCYIDDNTDEVREKILLIHTNSTTRELSDWEKLEQLAQLKELFVEDKKTNGRPGRVREHLADTLNISIAQVGRMEQVVSNLDPDIKQDLKENKINMSTAVELAKLPATKQKKVLNELQTRDSRPKAKDIKNKLITFEMLDLEQVDQYTEKITLNFPKNAGAHIEISISYNPKDGTYQQGYRSLFKKNSYGCISPKSGKYTTKSEAYYAAISDLAKSDLIRSVLEKYNYIPKEHSTQAHAANTGRLKEHGAVGAVDFTFKAAYHKALESTIIETRDKVKIYELEFQKENNTDSKNKLKAYKKIKELLELEKERYK